jgi:DNA-binding transcriptional regulator GbsR (MarR family)
MKTPLETSPAPPPVSAAIEAARRQFVEDYGVFVESRGQLPRMAGRIMGQLLLTNDELQPQADLCKALQASAGAISATLRLLVERGYVERVSLPGVRKDYYRMAEEIWTRNLERAQKHYDDFTELTARGLEISTHYDEGAQARLREMHDLAEIEASHFEQLLAHWHTYRLSNENPLPH